MNTQQQLTEKETYINKFKVLGATAAVAFTGTAIAAGIAANATNDYNTKNFSDDNSQINDASDKLKLAGIVMSSSLLLGLASLIKLSRLYENYQRVFAEKIYERTLNIPTKLENNKDEIRERWTLDSKTSTKVAFAAIVAFSSSAAAALYTGIMTNAQNNSRDSTINNHQNIKIGGLVMASTAVLGTAATVLLAMRSSRSRLKKEGPLKNSRIVDQSQQTRNQETTNARQVELDTRYNEITPIGSAPREVSEEIEDLHTTIEINGGSQNLSGLSLSPIPPLSPTVPVPIHAGFALADLPSYPNAPRGTSRDFLGTTNRFKP